MLSEKNLYKYNFCSCFLNVLNFRVNSDIVNNTDHSNESKASPKGIYSEQIYKAGLSTLTITNRRSMLSSVLIGNLR